VPGLRELHARVASLPGVAAYLASASRPRVFGMARIGPKIDPRPLNPGARPFESPWTKPTEPG